MARVSARARELTATAARIFARKGYAAASVQEVADGAGVPKGSVYAHITCKEDLLFWILDAAHEQTASLMDEVMALQATPVERLREYLRRHVIWFLENLDLVTVFFHEWDQVTGDRLALVHRRRRQYDSFLRGLIEDCKSSGAAPAQLDPKYASFYLLSAVNSTPEWHDQVGADEIEPVARSMAEMAINLITTPQGARA